MPHSAMMALSMTLPPSSVCNNCAGTCEEVFKYTSGQKIKVALIPLPPLQTNLELLSMFQAAPMTSSHKSMYENA